MSSDRKIPNDRELEDFLAGKHPVGRAYREVSQSETAPRELDDAILRMAREHAQVRTQTPTTARPLRRPRWIQPIAIAATLALSVGVLMNIWRDPALREQAAPVGEEDFGLRDERERSAPAPSSQDAAAQAEVMPERRRQARVEIPAVEDPKFDFYALHERDQPAARESKELAKPLESRRAEPFPRKDQIGAASPSSDDRAAPPPPPAPASPRASSPAMETAPSSAAMSAEPPAAAAGAVAPSRPDLDPTVLERDAKPNLKKSLPEESSNQFGEASSQSSSMPAAKGAPSPAPVIQAQEEKSEVQADEPIAEDAAAAGASLDRSKEERPSRESLIERARAALSRGNPDEVRRLVADLRRHYPETPLPEDLRAFAPPER